MRTLLMTAVLAGAVLAAPMNVVPDRDWAGVLDDDTLADVAPKEMLITDAKTFEKVWKAWRKDEKVPEVDFKKQFIAVTVNKGGPNKPRVSATIEDGKLKLVAISTLIGGPGFGYSLALFNREGVKEVQGKKLP